MTRRRDSQHSALALARVNAARASGYTLVEVMIVLLLIAILAGMAVPVTADRLWRARADSTTRETLTWFEDARSRASSERRNFEVTFDSALHRIRIRRVEADGARTPIMDRELTDDMEFMQFAGVPDTPDRFGNGAAVDFDGPAPHMFTSDGSFMDANGDPSNGTIFLGRPRRMDSVRAITVFGVTGLIRTWKWSGRQWTQ